MPGLKPGQTVFVRCEIQPGAFSDEYLITIHTDKGVMSGFVKGIYLRKPQPGPGLVSSQVLAVQSGQITVRFPGSFFTTASGVTSFSSDWANENLELARSV